MVVTRKGTASPIPPSSRTNSSTSSPKLKPKKLAKQPTVASPLHTAPTVGNGSLSKSSIGNPDPLGPEFDDPPRFLPSPKKIPPKKDTPKAKQKAKGKKSKASSQSSSYSSYFYFIFNILFLFFAGSLFSAIVIVCPNDSHLQNPICSGLDHAYTSVNNHILYPHVYPSIQQALNHPQVAPIVKRAQPVIYAATHSLSPYASQAKKSYKFYAGLTSATAHIYADPYLKTIEAHYQAHLQPWVQKAQPYIHPVRKLTVLAAREAQPILQKCLKQLRIFLIKARPYVHILWKYSCEVPGFLKLNVWDPINDLRRTYVDPHVLKMKQTVEEMAGDSKQAQPTRFEKSFMARAAETPKRAHEDTEGLDLDDQTYPSELPTSTTRSTNSAEADHDAEATPAEQIFRHVDHDNIEDEELAAFLRDLNADPATEEATPAAETPVATDARTAEEDAENKRLTEAETAEKRAALVARHAEWEQKMQKTAEAHMAKLPKLLEAIRARAIGGLKSHAFNIPLEKDADKALKNVEAYVKKLMTGSYGGAEKVAMLDSLVEKVRQKFEDGTDVIGQKVITWWESARAIEAEVIEDMANDIKNVAEKAQADLGLDYAWLDDVTVADWTRYHDLIFAATSYKNKLVELANGAHPDSPSNALNVAMQELQLEMQKTVLRFKNMLGATQKKGLNTFRGIKTTPSEESEDPTFSILPVPDTEKGQITDPEGQVEPDATQIFLGKSEAQVEDAIKQAEAAAAHDEL